MVTRREPKVTLAGRERIARGGQWLIRAALEPASGVIKPEPVRQRKVARAYQIAVIIAAVLILLALFNNQRGLATAVVLALIIGLSYPAFTVHHSGIATIVAMLWWVGTAPLIATLTALAASSQTELFAQFGGSLNTVVAVGVFVWIAAVLMRARRPWLTILVCWALNFVFTGAGLLMGVGIPSIIGWVGVVLYLSWRSGAPLLAVTRWRDRSARDRVLREATDVQREVFERLGQLRKDIPVLFQLKPPLDYGVNVPVDALVVGPTGVFGVYAVDALGRLRVNVSQKRRIQVEQRGIDSDLYEIASSADAVSAVLRVEVVPIAAMVGATFPAEYPGLIRITTTPTRVDEIVHLTLLDPDLLLDRIYYGDAIYSTGQQATIARRAAASLRSESRGKAGATGDGGKASERSSGEAAVLNDLAEIFTSTEPDRPTGSGDLNEEGAGSFYPGAEVVWTDSAGSWEGWVCTTGIVSLPGVPEMVVDTTLTAGDDVVWIVSKAEWERASANRRDVDQQLKQPVRPTDLTIS